MKANCKVYTMTFVELPDRFQLALCFELLAKSLDGKYKRLLNISIILLKFKIQKKTDNTESTSRVFWKCYNKYSRVYTANFSLIFGLAQKRQDDVGLRYTEPKFNQKLWFGAYKRNALSRPKIMLKLAGCTFFFVRNCTFQHSLFKTIRVRKVFSFLRTSRIFSLLSVDLNKIP